jgi:hypothetical protein
VFVLFALAKVGGTKKLLQTDDVCALFCGVAYARKCLLHIRFGISSATHLD